MQFRGVDALYSASDVVDACACPVLPSRERARLLGDLAFTPSPDPEQESVAGQATVHEEEALDSLTEDRRTVVAIPASPSGGGSRQDGAGHGRGR